MFPVKIRDRFLRLRLGLEIHERKAARHPRDRIEHQAHLQGAMPAILEELAKLPERYAAT